MLGYIPTSKTVRVYHKKEESVKAVYLERYLDQFPFLRIFLAHARVPSALFMSRSDTDHGITASKIAKELAFFAIRPWGQLDLNDKSVHANTPSPVGVIGGSVLYYIVSLARTEPKYVFRGLAPYEDQSRTVGLSLKYERDNPPTRKILGIIRISEAHIGHWGNTPLGVEFFPAPTTR